MAFEFDPRATFAPNASTPEQMGVVDAGQVFNNIIKGNQAGFSQRNLAAALLQQQLQNKIDQAKADIAPQLAQAGLSNTLAGTDLTRAQTGAIPSEIQERLASALKTQADAQSTAISNQTLDELNKARIKETLAHANMFDMGGSGGAANVKTRITYLSAVGRDNPGLTDEQKLEAANAYANGQTALSDGTPLAPLTPLTRLALDAYVKSTTTAPAITQSINANQAEAEVNKLQQYATQLTKPYGNTYFNYSPKQIMDSFKGDDASQERLGRFIAGQALAFETAQQRIKMAQGQPGVTSTKELIDMSQQVINAKYPSLSQKAREVAAETMDEALTAGLHARNAVGLSPSFVATHPESKVQMNPDVSKAVGSYLSANGGSPYAKTGSDNEVVTVRDKLSGKTMRMTRKAAKELAQKEDQII